MSMGYPTPPPSNLVYTSKPYRYLSRCVYIHKYRHSYDVESRSKRERSPEKEIKKLFFIEYKTVIQRVSHPLSGSIFDASASCRQRGHSGFSLTQSRMHVQQNMCPHVVALGSLNGSRHSVHLRC